MLQLSLILVCQWVVQEHKALHVYFYVHINTQGGFVDIPAGKIHSMVLPEQHGTHSDYIRLRT